MNYTRRDHLEFDLSSEVDWENVSDVKLVLYLNEHAGSGKRDTIQVHKTEKSSISEENWTWNNTDPLIENAKVIGEQHFLEKDAGSWVEIDIIDLTNEMEDDTTLSLALYPKERDDQGGVKFYSTIYRGRKIYTLYSYL